MNSWRYCLVSDNEALGGLRASAFLPSALHDVLVDFAISEDFFLEELVGEENQEGGHRFKEDAVGDVSTGNRYRTDDENTLDQLSHTHQSINQFFLTWGSLTDRIQKVT